MIFIVASFEGLKTNVQTENKDAGLAVVVQRHALIEGIARCLDFGVIAGIVCFQEKILNRREDPQAVQVNLLNNR